MIGTVVALAIAYWYFRDAEAKGRNPLKTAGLGFVFYLIPAVLWTWLVTPSLRDAATHNPTSLYVFVYSYTYILVGIACAAWVKWKHFN